MYENIISNGEVLSQNREIDIVSRGVKTHLTVSELAINIDNKFGNVGFLLNKPEVLFVRALIENPNRAFLGTELDRLKPNLQSYKYAPLYSKLTAKFGPHIIRDNFIAFGHGNAKRYGLLSNSDDPTKLIYEGRRSINQSEYSERRKNKQLRSYDELEAFYDSSEERRYSRKKLLGATAIGTTITIGGTMYLIYKKTHTE